MKQAFPILEDGLFRLLKEEPSKCEIGFWR